MTTRCIVHKNVVLSSGQVLVLAMALSYGVEDFVEGGVITAVIVLNVVIGFYQEYQAEKKMDALRSLSSPSAAVMRDGTQMTVPSMEVVPGDIVSIKTGDTVPADLRMFEVMNLECDEAILTGEALPVAKEVEFDAKDGAKKDDLGLGDRLNIAYSSSTVTKGRGQGVVVYTGMSTAIGGIAASMQSKRRKPNRSMSRKDGPMQPLKGGALRLWDGVLKFLGLTEGTPLQASGLGEEKGRTVTTLTGTDQTQQACLHAFRMCNPSCRHCVRGQQVPRHQRSGHLRHLHGHRHYSRVSHRRPDHHNGCGNDTNAQADGRGPTVECSRSPRRGHQYLL